MSSECRASRSTLFFFSTSSGLHGEVGPVNAPRLLRLRKVWPILLGVYLLNAFFVDMAYQFVIGLLFTIAGMLCATEEFAS